MCTVYKAYFAKILGELFEMKNESVLLQECEPVVPKYIVWGLKNGIEPIVDQFFRDKFTLSYERYNDIVQYLENLSEDDISKINGFYDLRDYEDFERDEWQAAFILLKAEGRFGGIISRIEGSDRSPIEFRSFDL